MVKFIPLGGADDIGASAYYISINGTGILVDCGIHPRKRGLDSLPDLNKLDELPLDCVLITHAHQDHLGALPFLIKKFPHVKIFSTPQTKEIAFLTLNNAVSIIKKEETENKNFPAYTYPEVEFLVKSIRDYEYGEKFEVTGLLNESSSPLIAEFYDAGHILGSASILLEQDENKIFFTGDINLSPQSIMNGATLPDKKITTLITESTYGNTDTRILEGWKNESLNLAKFINKKIHSGGSVLIPVFSLGKTQEIISVISSLMEKKKIIDVPVFTGGLGRKISRVYDKNRYLVDRNNPNFELDHFPQNEIVLPKLFTEIKNNPSIVVSSSGMMIEGTLSFEIAKYWLRQKDFGVAIVGYMDPESPGYRISNLSMNEKIRLTDLSEEIVNQSEVKKFYFNSHSTRDELLEIIKKTKPENVIIIHGEEEGRNWLGSNTAKIIPSAKIFSPAQGNEIILCCN